MRSSTIISMLMAVVLGVVAAVLAKVWLEGQSAPAAQIVQGPAANISTRSVVVAALPLRFGVALSEENLSEVVWPTGAIPAGAFATKTELLKGKTRSVLAAIEKNEPVLQWKITGPGQRASLSALISENNMKAVTIRVNDVKGVAGFVLPGDRVDIFLTRTETFVTGDDEKSSRQFTDILLQNIRVLAVDQIADDKSDKPTVAKAVTVEVNTIAAQKLVLASSAGKLSLVLRRAGATNASGSRRITVGDLGVVSIGTVPTKPGKKTVVAKPPDLNWLIGVVRGTRREEVSVSKN